MRVARWLSRRDKGWWLSFALIGALGCTWSLANPLFATSDEGSHVIRAAGVSHFQFIGSELTPAQEQDLGWGVGGRQGPQPPAYRSFDVPAIYGTPNWSCFVFQPDVTPNCLYFDGPRTTAAVVTAVPAYPPLYYALVGIPARFVDAGSRSVYIMRFASSFLSAALLASAFATARSARNKPAVLGVMTAVTPLVLYLSSSVNPSGFEISAGIGLWSSGAALIANPTSRLVTRACVAASMLALSRHLGPLWVVFIVALLALYAGRDKLRSLAREVVIRRAAIVVGASLFLQTAWVLATGALDRDQTIYSGEDHMPVSQVFRRTVGAVYQWYRQMTGMFLGWGETVPPAGTFLIWTLVVSTLLVVAFLTATRRNVLVVAMTIAVAIGVPFVLDFGAASMRGNPLHWQGRHGMALAVGIPILAAFVSDRSGLAHRLDRLSRGLIGLLVLATALAFWSSLRRYTVGASGPLSYWVHPEWVPPVSPLLLTILYPLVLIGIAIQSLRPTSNMGNLDGKGSFSTTEQTSTAL